jgi:hypothetical protein
MPFHLLADAPAQARGDVCRGVPRLQIGREAALAAFDADLEPAPGERNHRLSRTLSASAGQVGLIAVGAAGGPVAGSSR